MRDRIIEIIRWIRKFTKEQLHSKNEDLPYYISIIVAIVIFGFALKVFVELADELAENELVYFDDAVSSYIISYRSPFLTTIFQYVTDLGDRYTYIALIIALGFFFYFYLRKWMYTLQITAVLILATLSNIALKRAINRPRPITEHLVTVNSLSFPSGHSMSAMAFYGFLIYLCFRIKMHKALRLALVILLSLLILSIGISRIYLGVHYPSDVLAGYMGGLLWITLCIIIFNIVDLLRKRRTARN
ncbi:phosphatase PAP2 family protein [Chryseosolibacter indicus]|uniref:Phosphatase PAP2 family protein n=1 Tax=Chryseosolibacter indicus TaxID=2782351 RepID=A0ABS5VYF5_9BACT|nr:phosphatase PAP2 family protein [Chryseosolibacter indicus]MBT1706450.1 phosphatase PAP2 family protein [Chryseosolibacter indicus]